MHVGVLARSMPLRGREQRHLVDVRLDRFCGGRPAQSVPSHRRSSTKRTRRGAGLGGIRDSFTDLLFPATRPAPDFLFIPRIYQELERHRTPPADIERLTRRDEILLIRRSRLTGQPSSRTGENPPYGMIGGIEETSASCEARSAPRSYPTGGRATASGDPVGAR